MATTKYFVLPFSTGANFTDFDLSYGTVTLAGEQVTFVGSTQVDAVFVRPGVTMDFTLSSSGVDKVYLGGDFASYTASITGSVMTLQRGSGATLESVSLMKWTSATTSDSIIFADGKLNTWDLFNNLKSGTALPPLSTTETSLAPLAPAAAGSALSATIKAFALNAAGDTFAPAHPGVAMTVVGNAGVDTVYVPRGGVVDCTLLDKGQDLIYVTGNWGDYSKVVTGSVITFTRAVNGYNESVRVVGGTTTSLNDQLIFADGAVHSADAKVALLLNSNVPITGVSGYDPTMITPGLAPTLNASALNNVTNLEVGSNLVLNYSEGVTAVAGKYIHIVNYANSVTGATGFHGESTVSTLNILVTDTSQVTISGGRVTLNPTADLDLSNNYHLTIDAGAFSGVSSHEVSAAYDGTSTLHFSTVTPGTSVLASSVASQVMNTDGTLGRGHLWLDIEGIGSPSASAGTALDLSANHYALVAKDYNAAGGDALLGRDGISVADFYVAANNFGAGDLLYIDNQSAAANDTSQLGIVNYGTPPTTLQFTGTGDGLGGLVAISLAGSAATFDTLTQLKSLLGVTADPIFSDGINLHVAPVINAVATDNIINAAEQATAITGVAESNASVNLTLGGNTRTVTTNSSGVWSYMLTAADITAMGQGTETLSAMATDVLGNVSGAATQVISIDTVAPAVALAAATDDVGAVTGALVSGATTDDTALFLSGTNEAGATVKVYNGVSLLGNATVTGTTWSYSATVADATTYQFNAKATDAAGNTSAATTNFTVIGDTTAPAVPVINTVATDNIVNATEQTTAITGTAEANATVNLSLGGNTRTVTANSSGVWSYTLTAADITAMGQGAETLSATATDVAGNSGAAGTRSISVDTVAPVAPTINAVATDDIVNATEQTTAISGTTEANATVNLSLGGNTRTVTANGSGVWSYTLTAADITAMGQGAETLSATATDVAGNSGAAGTRAISVDTVASAVALTAATDDVGSVTGALVSGARTDDTALVLSGTNEAGAVVKVYNGTTLLGNATVSGTTWSYTATVADGMTYQFNAKATGAAGNTSAATTNFTVIGDMTAPAVPVINTVATDNIVNATEQTAAISGTTEANATLNLSLGGNTRTVTANSSGIWSYTLTAADITAMGQGAETLSATATDTAGNISAAGTRAISVDTALPTLSTAVAQGTTLTLTYSEALNPAQQLSTSYFQLAANAGAARSIAGMQVSGSTVVLTLSEPLLPASSGLTYTLKYSDPSAGNDVYAIQDLAGNDAASIAAMPITVNAVAGTDTTAPSIVGATLTPGTGNSSVWLQFSEAVAFTNATGLTLTSSAGASVPFTLAAGGSSDTLVLTTTTTLASTDTVTVGYSSATGSIKDVAATPNSLASTTILLGGDGANTMTASSAAVIRANSGDDTITGSSSNDNIIAGAGIDIVEGGQGADTIILTESVRSTDTVKLINTSLASPIFGYDTIYAFDVSNTGGVNNDVLNLPSGTIAADTGITAATAVNGIAKYSIASGIVSFYDASSVAVAITSTNKADALNYLSANLTQAGRTVGFALDSDGNGQSDSLMVFQDGVAVSGYGNSDIVVQLAGVNGVTLSNTAGQNVVQIADTTAATSVVRSFATGANSVLTQTQSEDVSATGTGTAATILVNGAGTDVVTARNASGNTITFTTSATLAQTDWLLFTSGSNTADGAGNAGNAGNLALVGGSGANVINGTGVNVSGVTGTSTVNISAYGGNDQITGTAAADVIWGGAGADTVSGGLGADQFRFIQGDSTAVTVAVGGDATLNTGDIFTFTGGAADVVHGSFDVAGASGDRIQLFSLANQSNPTGVTAPTNGLVTDQKFFTVQGNYDGVSSFTVNTTSGLDTLVVYDGDATSGVTQTALVVQGHTPTTLTVSGNTLYANVADTDVTAPTLTTATVNGAVLTLTFSETIDPVHTPITFPDVLVGGVARALVDGAVNGNVVTLTLGTAVISSDVVTFSYTDPTSGNDANALQDLAGNDVASGAAIPVTNQTVVATPPTLSASLLDNVTNLEVSSNIVLNFSANVSAAAGKYIHIVNDPNSVTGVTGAGFHGESTVNTLDILVTDSTQVTIAGGKVTINPTADLDLANNYHITIDAGAFTASASGAAMAAYDGTTTLNFSTVTPGTSALANAAASQVMNADGTLGSGHLWLDIEGIGSPSATVGTALDLSANNYALVAKDYNAAGGDAPLGLDGISVADFYVAANNFGAGDLLYIDNQSAAANDTSQLGIVNYGTPPTTVQFTGAAGLGGLVDISLAGSAATFDSVNQLKSLLATTTAPVISA